MRARTGKVFRVLAGSTFYCEEYLAGDANGKVDHAPRVLKLTAARDGQWNPYTDRWEEMFLGDVTIYAGATVIVSEVEPPKWWTPNQ